MTSPDYKRLSEETLVDWKLRIFDNKVLYGLNSQQIADIINKDTEQNMNESTYRKWHATFTSGMKYAQEKLIASDEMIQQLEEKKIEIQKERVRLNDARRIYNEKHKDDVRLDDFKKLVHNAVLEIANEKPLVIENKLNKQTGSKEGVLLLSDIHYGMVTDSYFNKYNRDVFFDRIKTLVRKTIEYGKKNEISKLHTFVIGDLIHGIINLSGRIEANEDVVTQMKVIAETLSEVLIQFANEFNDINVYFCRGNHERVTPNKKEAIDRENFADIVLWFMQTRLSHIKNITFVENTYNDEIIVTDICAKKIVSMHGHRDTVKTVATSIPQMFGFTANYVFLAHYHHNIEEEFGITEVIVNNSFCGSDHYAIGRRLFAKPAQKFMIFDPEVGRECTYSIAL